MEMFFFDKDVVIMGAALEKAFYEQLAEMPSDVRGNQSNTTG
jgi:hypothetical protein